MSRSSQVELASKDEETSPERLKDLPKDLQYILAEGTFESRSDTLANRKPFFTCKIFVIYSANIYAHYVQGSNQTLNSDLYFQKLL